MVGSVIIGMVGVVIVHVVIRYSGTTGGVRPIMP